MFRRSVVFLFVGALAVGCQGGAASPAAPASAPAVPSVSAPAASGIASPSGSAAPSGSAGAEGQLAVVARDFSFQLPPSAPAGPVSVTLTNEGEEEHQAQFVKLGEGVTLDQLIAVLMQQDYASAFKMVTLVGGPTVITPGESQTITSNLDPGKYALLCFVASPDGIPHFAKGMVAQLDVTAPAAAGQLPTADSNLTLQDFAFVGLDELSAGQHVIKVHNNGPQPHEAGILSLAPGVTIDQLQSMMTATPPPSGAAPSPGASAAAPPVTSSGGSTAINPGLDTYLSVDLPPGNYAWICFVPDPATGKPHAALGMIGQLTVK